MSEHDPGVTDLLRRASDGLAPDVDRLVHGGITRGRTRQRRARIGTAAASLAVIGVVGGLAAVVPQGGSRTAPDQGIATQPTPTATAASTEPTGDPDLAPSADVLRPLVPGERMMDVLQGLTGASTVDLVSADPAAEDESRLFALVVDGAQVTFRIRWYNNPTVVEDGGDPLAPSSLCEPGGDDDCTTLPDGSRLLRGETLSAGGTGVPDAFLERSLSLATWDGWQIDLIARNTTGEKEGEVITTEPVLTIDQMESIALSDEWFSG